MWNKAIIVDKSVKHITTLSGQELPRRKFSYGFSGFSDDKKEEWTLDAAHVKLYDSVSDAIVDAKILNENLPVDVLNFQILNNHVQIVLVNF